MAQPSPAKTVKVDAADFTAAIRALLNTPPMPMAKVVTRRTKKSTKK